jgi:hypothetical protein
MAGEETRNAEAIVFFTLEKTLAVVFVRPVLRECLKLGLQKLNGQAVNPRHPRGGLLVTATNVAVDITLLQLFLFIVGFSSATQAKTELDVTAPRIQGKRDQCQAFLL